MELSEAIKQAVDQAVKGHYAATRAETKQARAKTIPDKTTIVEQFPIRVVHEGHHRGRNATITMDGCPRYYTVIQDFNRTQRNRNAWDKQRGPASWHVTMFDSADKNGISIEENTTDFESVVQKCIVALIGHAYYDGVA